MSATETELFDGTEYVVPFPQADGHQVTDLALRIAGSLRFNRNDPDHATMIESLTLGRVVTLEVTASVDAKLQGIRHDADGNEIVTHTVGLKIHTVDTK
jgi:hypothetical protein